MSDEFFFLKGRIVVSAFLFSVISWTQFLFFDHFAEFFLNLSVVIGCY